MKNDSRHSIELGLAGACLFTLALLSAGCGGDGAGELPPPTAPDQAGHGHDHETGVHGGEILGLGNGQVHVEFLHDESRSRVDLFLLGADGESRQETDQSPAINVRTAEGPQQIAARPVGGSFPSSHFEAIDPVFGGHDLDGQLVVSVAGKQYYAPLPVHAHAHAENAISLTSWTERNEWFVELETPEAGKPVAFAAHLTVLDSFEPVTSGTFRVEARCGAQTATTEAAAPARAGIFTPSITFPVSGAWSLRLSYEGEGESDSVEWPVIVYEAGEAPSAGLDEEGTISFLKEQQWKIPFRTGAVEKRTLETTGEVLAIPASAVLDDGGIRVVYVQVSGESFKRGMVKTGDDTGPYVEIQSGLNTGDRVVTTGAKAIREAAARE